MQGEKFTYENFTKEEILELDSLHELIHTKLKEANYFYRGNPILIEEDITNNYPVNKKSYVLSKEEVAAIYKTYNYKVVFRRNTDDREIYQAGITPKGYPRIITLYNKFWKVSIKEKIRTLIHEMAHVANYDHDEKTRFDKPFDGGEYYESTPLRAEIFMTGSQTFLPNPGFEDQDTNCSPNDSGDYIKY